MVRNILATTMFLLFNFVSATSAIAQGSWLFMVPPVNEAQEKALPKDPEFQAMGFENKRSAIRKLAINTKAPLAEWDQQSAFDSAAQCEDFKWDYLTVQDKGIANMQRHLMSDEHKKEVQERQKEGKKLREDILKGARDEKARRAISEMLDAQDRSWREINAGIELRQLIKNEQTEAGRCLPASVLFPAKR